MKLRLRIIVGAAQFHWSALLICQNKPIKIFSQNEVMATNPIGTFVTSLDDAKLFFISVAAGSHMYIVSELYFSGTCMYW